MRGRSFAGVPYSFAIANSPQFAEVSHSVKALWLKS
jgi:hypothetical protein